MSKKMDGPSTRSDMNMKSKIRLSRSPKPYFRRKSTLEAANHVSGAFSADQVTHISLDAYSENCDVIRDPVQEVFASPEESGTDGEEHNSTYLKALPAPVFRPRKGLRDTFDPSVSTGQTPAVTPSASSELHGVDSGEYFDNTKLIEELSGSQRGQARILERKRSEIIRRSFEISSLSIISFIVFRGSLISSPFLTDFRNSFILTPLVIYLSLGAIYFWTIFWGQKSTEGTKLKFPAFRIPTSFDPAPLIYPTVLPILVASSLSSSAVADPLSTISVNTVLSIAALPTELIPIVDSTEAFDSVHWLLSLVPLLLYHQLSNVSEANGSINAEVLCILFPLHRTLLPPLHYLTTSSLLRSELHLLSIALINVLILSSSPQLLIMRSIIWIGGYGIFLLCYRLLKWNVALERMPSSRYYHTDRGTADIQYPLHSSSEDAEHLPKGANLELSSRRRSQTIPGGVDSPSKDMLLQATTRRRSRSFNLQESASISNWKLEAKKWGYAAYTYLIAASLILFPIRHCISTEALLGQEPFLWALDYLFSGIPYLSSPVTYLPLSNGLFEYIRVCVIGASNTRLLLFSYWAFVLLLGIAAVLYLSSSVEVDTRRKIFHGTMVFMLLPTTFIDPLFLSLGLTLVLSVFLLLDLFRASQLRPISKPLAQFLAPYVDGRDLRGPVVVSHIFLLIGCAIPLWLSLSGMQRTTLVESSIRPESDTDVVTRAWVGWEVPTRDVSMVAGVICVGIGDAAASLVGRRIGRHKWPWRGGKSLEGSTAFVVAVTAGLLFAKAWLWCGGWTPTPHHTLSKAASITTAGSTTRDHLQSGSWEVEYGDLQAVEKWWEVLLKAVIAASGASFTEAVLTGCNDNVVVPIVLWLLVRGCDAISFS